MLKAFQKPCHGRIFPPTQNSRPLMPGSTTGREGLPYTNVPRDQRRPCPILRYGAFHGQNEYLAAAHGSRGACFTMTATEPSHFPSSLTISGLLISFENEQHGSVPELFFRLFFPASRKAPQHGYVFIPAASETAFCTATRTAPDIAAFSRATKQKQVNFGHKKS